MYDGTILFNYITRILFLKTSTDMYGTFTNRWPYRRFPTHTYFNQRPANITASLPQGGRPGGLSAAQTSIFFGGCKIAPPFFLGPGGIAHQPIFGHTPKNSNSSHIGMPHGGINSRIVLLHNLYPSAIFYLQNGGCFYPIHFNNIYHSLRRQYGGPYH